MKVSVIMGSMSDFLKVEQAVIILKRFGVEVDIQCLSAHRCSAELSLYLDKINNDGTEVIIAAAGMAAALPGVVASYTTLPVIGVPIKGASLDGVDALYSIVQMPSGIPVATVAIDGTKNAAYLALEILSIKYESIRELLKQERLDMKNAILKANQELQNKYKGE